MITKIINSGGYSEQIIVLVQINNTPKELCGKFNLGCKTPK